MIRYCLDSNTLIEAKNGPYGMDFAPGFWTWLDRQFSEGRVYSVLEVYRELADYGDELSEWVRAREAFFVEPSEPVQAAYAKIASWISDTYPPQNASKFLDGADPWIIAQAMVDGSVVVTHEKPAGPGSKTPKIPDTCDRFGVAWIDLFRLLRKMRARLVLGDS